MSRINIISVIIDFSLIRRYDYQYYRQEKPVPRKKSFKGVILKVRNQIDHLHQGKQAVNGVPPTPPK